MTIHMPHPYDGPCFLCRDGKGGGFFPMSLEAATGALNEIPQCCNSIRKRLREPEEVTFSEAEAKERFDLLRTLVDHAEKAVLDHIKS